MHRYFTNEEIALILSKHITYEIKVNGEKITTSNLNYNITNDNAVIEITAIFSDKVYPKELIAEICPLEICPQGNEKKEIISLHTTMSDYKFTSENSGLRHKYTYNVSHINPGEIITLQIHSPQILANLSPKINKLEVIRTK